ncbi:MAG: peroxiredoxin Q/BCP [Puniceicoccaceae bacterium 5H]|nr:MAG: peroxiredoxin Q/BCP [Puniceicoccaceae bacterium 5H]
MGVMNKFLWLLIGIFTLPLGMLRAEPLEPGKDAPKLTVMTHEGKQLDLAEIYEQGPTLVYFYPKADTPGCTAQACNIRDHFESVKEAGITVIGVSADGIVNQKAFAEKYELPFTLVPDPNKRLGKAFGVDDIMGKVFKRQTFLVVDGKIVWRDLSAEPKSQAQDAIAALQDYQHSHQG